MTLPSLSRRVSDEGAVTCVAPVRTASSGILPNTARAFPFSSLRATLGPFLVVFRLTSAFPSRCRG